jgi:LPS export ABC transporter permease LptG/LPS export ABC transporter permease LptF
VKLIDRYIVREVLTPFLFALGMFTFVFGIQPALHQAQSLLAKGVDLATVGFLLLTLLPQALGLSLPMAFMAGLLMGLGRLSGDREAVALLACGVSPLRMLRPILLLAVIAGLADMYVLMQLIPDANQAFRVRTTQLLASKSESDIRPGTFYEGFPGKVLRIEAQRPEGGWNQVFLADTSDPGRQILTLASVGYLEVDHNERQVAIVLPGESVRYTPGAEPGVYDMSRARDLRFAISAESVFGDGAIVQRGNREMRIPELQREEARKRAAGISPHPEIIQRHQMFSFPVACLVFALVGLALGVHSRKEGKLGGFTLGLAVLFAYYGIMVFFEGKTKGGSFPAEWARWMPNIILGIVGLLAIWWRMRAVGGGIAIRIPAVLAKVFARQPSTARSVRSASRIVVVIRIPDVRLPRPRLLDLYVSRRYLSVVALSFAALLGLYYIGTVIDKSERLFKGDADGWMLASFLYYSTPQFLAYVMPMAVLFAVLATVGALTRTGELVVMRSCGVSLYRAALPLLVIALLWTGGLFLLDDRVLARANRRAEELDRQIRGGPARQVQVATTANWLVDTRGRIYTFSLFEAPGVLHSVSIFEPAARSFELASHTWAASATYSEGGWLAKRGWVQKFSANNRSTQQAFTTRRLDLDPPDRFPALQNQDTGLMTFGELRHHINERATRGQAVVEPRLNLQQRIAFPMVAVVMTILGVPFGATTGRRGSLYGIGLALILGVGYWLLNTFFLAVGEAALMPAVLAAWAANLLFLALAAYMTLTVRT